MAMEQLKYTNVFHSKPKVCPAFCDCEFPDSLNLNTCKVNISEFVKCHCGEEDWHVKQWQWHKGEADACIDGPDITFHPSYSQGTAIVRGDTELSVGMVHFWEMRMITPLSGTDVMFGIGTEDFDLDMYRTHFTSPLGINKKTWGYSYQARIHHDGHQRSYGERVTQGCILGIYLDRARGYLEYFLNRRSMGVAFVNIPLHPEVKLYPMVSSTAAKSIVRLLNATSLPATLQLYAFKALSRDACSLKLLRQMPGFSRLMRDFWFLTPPTRYSQCEAENDLDLLDLAVLPKNTRLKRRQNYDVYTIKEDDENEALLEDEEVAFYPNPRKIALHELHDDSRDFEFFDEFFHPINSNRLMNIH